MQMLSDYQIDFLKKIISVPSVGGAAEENAPYGRMPRKVLEVFLSEAAKHGFRTGMTGDRAGWVEFGSGERLLGIICHLDVVPVSEGWSSDPFTLDIRRDEKGCEALYARGIVDDKGPACASFFAMKELLDEGKVPENCRVRLILGTDEERSCSCIRYYAAHDEVPDFSIAPDSVFPVIFSEKGITQLRITGENKSGLEARGGSAVNIVPSSAFCVIDGKRISADGRAAHASKPELGENALTALVGAAEKDGICPDDHPVLKLIRELDGLELSKYSAGDDTGSITRNLGKLKADAAGCELMIDLRIPATADKDALLKAIKDKSAEYGFTAEVTLDLPPLLLDKSSAEVQKLTGIWERHMDRFSGFTEGFRRLYSSPAAAGVGTYARHIPNTVAFGIQAPWQSDQCHQTDEHISVNDFLQWIEIIREFICEFA